MSFTATLTVHPGPNVWVNHDATAFWVAQEPATTAAYAPLGEEWVELGYTSEPAAIERKTPLRRNTPMAPGKPLETRRRPMRSNPAPEPKSVAARAAHAGPRPTPTGPGLAVRTLVLHRDDMACVACGGPLDTWCGYSLQHRVARGMGGRHGAAAARLNSAANLLTLCGSGTTGCHGAVEADRDGVASANGWAVPSWAEPSTVPVYLTAQRTWVLLSDDGTRTGLDVELTNALDYPGLRRQGEPPDPPTPAP